MIETKTKYPKRKRLFKVYINEITKGVAVRFKYSKNMFEVDTTAVFSGRERFPVVRGGELGAGASPATTAGRQEMGDGRLETGDWRQEIVVETDKDTWVFPSSVVMFSFNNIPPPVVTGLAPDIVGEGFNKTPPHLGGGKGEVNP